MGSIIDKYGTSNPNYKSASTPTGAAPAREMTIVEKYGTSNPNYVAPKPAAGYTDPLIDAARGGATTKTPAQTDTEEPSFLDRVKDTFFGAFKRTVGSNADMMGARYEATQGRRDTMYKQELEWAQHQLDRAEADLAAYTADGNSRMADITRAEVEQLKQKLKAFDTVTEGQVQQKAATAAHDLAAEVSKSGEADTERAMEGLGFVGKTAVALGTAGAEALGDAAIGKFLGVGGSLPLMSRVFGSGTQQRREEGASLGSQIAYGTLSASAAAGFNKLTQFSKTLKNVYGGGIVDIEEAIMKAASKLTKNAVGQQILANFMGGAGEEAIEAALDPLIRLVTGDKGVMERTFGTKEAATDFVADVLYEGLIGGLFETTAKGLDVFQRGNATVLDEATQNAQNGAPNAPASRVWGEEDNNAPAPQDGTGASVGANEPVTANMVNGIAKDPAALAELGIDPNGKTASQLRAEVREKLTGVTQSDVNAEVVSDVAAPVETPAVDPMVQTARASANPANDVFAEDVRKRAQNPSVGAADAGFDRYTALENEYGTLPEKKNPYRPDDVPASITGKDKVSENAVSMKGSELTKDEFVPVIEAAVLRGDFSFQGLSNNRVVRESIRKIKAKGFRKALSEWKSAMEKGSADPELTARAMLMYNIAQEAGDNDLALDILLDAQANTRESARVVQINRLWQTMRPEAQLAALYRKVERISNERAKKKAGNVPVDEWMTRVGQYLAAHIKQRMNVSEEQAQTVSQTILSDLKQMYAEDNPKPKMGKKKRSTVDRLHDLLENFDKYSEAAEVAKANMLEGIEDEALRDSIGEWFDTLPEFGSRLARELTGDEGITIPDNLAKAYLSAETDAKRDEVLDEIAKKVAEQTPTSLGEIYNTLRYVNMLFNLKTQVRNVAGNSVMSVIDKARNAVAVGLQKLTGVEKTRVGKVDAEHKAIGLDDYDTVKRGLESQQKYKDNKFTGDDFAMRVDDAKTVNNTGSKNLDKLLGGLQKANEWTSWLMNNDKFGDSAFLKKHYSNALGGYLQAQGITAEQWNDAQWQADNAETVNAARDFAIKPAQETTFRDSNELSDFISTFARGKNTPAWAKAVFEGLLPFRRTPANILVRATEYSPFGLVVTGVNAGRGKLADADIRSAIGQRLQETFGKENVTADYLVEQLSKNITGTGLMALGFILAKLGFLRGGDDDDEKQAAFDSLTGRQPYAIEWEANGKVHSYTIDWLTPAAMPLFMGAEAAEVAADGDVSVKDIGEVLLSVTDPMLELSMLQGIQDAIDSVQYSDGGFSGFMQILANAALNNVTQALTSTLGGQIERTFEPNRMTTYVDKNKDTASWKQYARGKAAAKGLGEYGQTEYIDAWGRTESNGSLVGRAFENFLSPGYYSAKDIDPLEQEIQRLYKSTGENVLPERAPKSFENKGETVNLTAEQYTEYATTRGNEMYDLMQKVVNDSKYKSASDTKKAEMLKDAKTYANAVAKDAVVDTEMDKWVERAKSGKYGLNADRFILYRSMLSTVDKPNKNGNLGTYTDDEKRAAARKAGITNTKAIDWVIGK